MELISLEHTSVELISLEHISVELISLEKDLSVTDFTERTSQWKLISLETLQWT